MIASNNIRERAEEIQFLIATDNVQEGIKLLLDFTRDFSEDKADIQEVIVISSSYHRLEKIERRGTMAYDQIEQSRNKLLYQILALIDSIEIELALNLAS